MLPARSEAVQETLFVVRAGPIGFKHRDPKPVSKHLLRSFQFLALPTAIKPFSDAPSFHMNDRGLWQIFHKLGVSTRRQLSGPHLRGY